MDYLIINVVGLLLIGFVAWWFWLGKKTAPMTKATDAVIDIKVADGVYDPEAISVKAGEKIVLRFTRLEENPCAQTVVFADFNKSVDLPIGKPVEIELTPDKTGEFEFTCQMGMYRGKLIIEE